MADSVLAELSPGYAWLKAANTDGTVGVVAKDLVKGKNDRRGRRDDRAADDGHLALVHVAAPDGEAAIDDGGDAEDKAEHHDHGETVADAGFQVGGIEGGALGVGGDGVEGEDGGDHEERGQPRTDFRIQVFDDFHTHYVFVFVLGPAAFSAGRAMTFSQARDAVVYDLHHMQ